MLINSCLSSIPTYTMEVCLLLEGVHHKWILLGQDFFWEGRENIRKYHMMKCEALCRPKDFGGLGFANTRVMNIVLLGKWIARIE